jgi:hypothetical protein
MAMLVFDMEELRPLVEMTRAAKEFTPTFSDLLDPKIMKPGAKPSRDRFYDAKDVDHSKVEPCLNLVHDEGVYMMSNAVHQKKGPDGRLPVAYAKGLGKDADYDVVRDAVGGDDFVEKIPLEWYDAAVKAGATQFCIEMTSDRMEFVLPQPKAGSKKKSPRA